VQGTAAILRGSLRRSRSC